MTSALDPSAIGAYWSAAGVECAQCDLRTQHGDTELSGLLFSVGLPMQTWWLFRFLQPPEALGDGVLLGSVGEDTQLEWRAIDGTCWSVTDGHRELATSSFLAFLQFLVLFDRAYRRVQVECPGDTGEDWDRGDAIIDAMEESMRGIDAAAFRSETQLWPRLLLDING